MPMRYTAARRAELDKLGDSLPVPQPNRGRHDCGRCGQVFRSEAGFAYHLRFVGPRKDTECLGARVLRRVGFAGNEKGWTAPRKVEYWYLDNIDRGGFAREDWK